MNDPDVPPSVPGKEPGDGKRAVPGHFVFFSAHPFWRRTVRFLVVFFSPPMLLIACPFFFNHTGYDASALVLFVIVSLLMLCSSVICALWLCGGVKGKSFWKVLGFLTLIPLLWGCGFTLAFVGCTVTGQFRK